MSTGPLASVPANYQSISVVPGGGGLQAEEALAEAEAGAIGAAGGAVAAATDDELERPEGAIDRVTRVLAPDVRLVIPEVELLAEAGDAAELSEVARRPGVADRGARIGGGAGHGDQARSAGGPAEVDLRGAFALAVRKIQGCIHKIEEIGTPTEDRTPVTWLKAMCPDH